MIWAQFVSNFLWTSNQMTGHFKSSQRDYVMRMAWLPKLICWRQFDIAIYLTLFAIIVKSLNTSFCGLYHLVHTCKQCTQVAVVSYAGAYGGGFPPSDPKMLHVREVGTPSYSMSGKFTQSPPPPPCSFSGLGQHPSCNVKHPPPKKKKKNPAYATGHTKLMFCTRPIFLLGEK